MCSPNSGHVHKYVNTTCLDQWACGVMLITPIKNHLFHFSIFLVIVCCKRLELLTKKIKAQ